MLSPGNFIFRLLARFGFAKKKGISLSAPPLPAAPCDADARRAAGQAAVATARAAERVLKKYEKIQE